METDHPYAPRADTGRPSIGPTGLEPDPADSGQPFSQRPQQSFFKRRIAPIGAAILAFLTKIKSIILLLPKLKLLLTAGSMVVSVAAYATIWGWQFAARVRRPAADSRDGSRDRAAREGIKRARRCSSRSSAR